MTASHTTVHLYHSNKLLIDWQDTSAEYLGGQGWKEFWVDVVVNRVPWNHVRFQYISSSFAWNCCRICLMKTQNFFNWLESLSAAFTDIMNHLQSVISQEFGIAINAMNYRSKVCSTEPWLICVKRTLKRRVPDSATLTSTMVNTW